MSMRTHFKDPMMKMGGASATVAFFNLLHGGAEGGLADEDKEQPQGTWHMGMCYRHMSIIDQLLSYLGYPSGVYTTKFVTSSLHTNQTIQRRPHH